MKTAIDQGLRDSEMKTEFQVAKTAETTAIDILEMCAIIGQYKVVSLLGSLEI